MLWFGMAVVSWMFGPCLCLVLSGLHDRVLPLETLARKKVLEEDREKDSVCVEWERERSREQDTCCRVPGHNRQEFSS